MSNKAQINIKLPLQRTKIAKLHSSIQEPIQFPIFLFIVSGRIETPRPPHPTFSIQGNRSEGGLQRETQK